VLRCSWKDNADARTHYRYTMSQAGAACQHGFQRRRNARLGKTKSTGARFTSVTCMFAQLDPAITILVVQIQCSMYSKKQRFDAELHAASSHSLLLSVAMLLLEVHNFIMFICTSKWHIANICTCRRQFQSASGNGVYCSMPLHDSQTKLSMPVCH
jgi:hypothetical protein